MRTFIITVVLIIFSQNLMANDKLYVEGDTLHYNTDLATVEGNAEINWEDANSIHRILLENPNLKLIHLNSSGGLVEASQYISDLIIDFELDTRVTDECASACVTLFLAGESRQLDRGGRLGFHRSSWDAASMEEYYKDARADIGWDSLYEFASWSYEEAQKDVLSEMEYLLERGVDPEFAIKTLRAENADMWFPRRRELTLAGVLSKP